MNLSLQELTKVNRVQVEILRQIAAVCQKLDIKFFVVHGTLLGTVRSGTFIPYDDDIDIAIPRDQYERFLAEAPKLLDPCYFVQCAASDPKYPLEFAKVRDSRTTYIVENSQHLPINHGIYVDIFPIDHAMNGKLRMWLHKLFTFRVGFAFHSPNLSMSAKLKRSLVGILIPSYKLAKKLQDRLRKKASSSQWVCMTGGKPTEHRMPAQWFLSYEERTFEGVAVYIPGNTHAYLTHIYGNYETRTLVEGKMAGRDAVILNASVVDPQKPYTHYL